MTYRVILTRSATRDLDAISSWVEREADASIADAYDRRIRARIAALSDFPLRGAPKDDLMAGLRSISFERRIVIYYRVRGDSVRILRVVSGARDQPSLFRR